MSKSQISYKLECIIKKLLTMINKSVYLYKNIYLIDIANM